MAAGVGAEVEVLITSGVRPGEHDVEVAAYARRVSGRGRVAGPQHSAGACLTPSAPRIWRLAVNPLVL